MRWFVDYKEPAFRQWAHYLQAGQRRKAALMAKIAAVPRFRWFGNWYPGDPYQDQTYSLNKSILPYIWRAQCCNWNWDTSRYECPDQPTVPLLAVMRHQGKKCDGRDTAGGEEEDARARRWYETFAHTVSPFRIVIAFEPDALGTLECLAPYRRSARLRLLRYGISLLSQLPNATVYLDAGASDWEPASRTARQLRYIGIDKVRGFVLNTTHYGLDRGEHQARPEDLASDRRQAVHRVDGFQRARAGAHQGEGAQALAATQRLVPPAAPGPRGSTDHRNRQSQGRRVHVGRTAGLLGRLVQRRAPSDRCVVATKGAHVRRACDSVAPPSAWHLPGTLPALFTPSPWLLRTAVHVT